MKRLLKISNNITLILCSISIAGIIFTNTFFLILRNMIIEMGDVESFMDKFSIPVAIVYIIFGLFHLSAMLTLILQLNFFKRENFFRAFLFFVGTISLMMLFGDFALLSDISKEYIFGLPSEFNILFFSQVLHFIFYALMIVILIAVKKSVGIENGEQPLRDDSIFINAQFIGVLSGITGLTLITVFCLLYLPARVVPLWIITQGIIMISLVAVIPYILIVIYWLVLKLRERITEWYDEKQYQDITRASLITLIISIIVMGIFFIIQHFNGYFEFFNEIWFPFYIFLVLLLFSASTLYFSKDLRLISIKYNDMLRAKRNRNLGLSVLIISYLTLVSWFIAIFLGIELGIGWESYTVIGFFILFLATSGILFLISLILNIIESRKNRHMSRGMILTLISIPPITFCYMAVLLKALTEGH